MNTTDAKRIVETALICAQQPLSLREMGQLFDEALNADSLRLILEALQTDWSLRGVELVYVASGWRFQSRPEMRQYLDKLHPEKPPRYSRAVLETLAIVAYRQPVTRGNMEDIRGVTINSMILKQLEERGWIEVIGHRETVGRPALYATTRQFLDDLGVQSLDQLPTMNEAAWPEAAGQFDLAMQAIPPISPDKPQLLHADSLAMSDEVASSARAVDNSATEPDAGASLSAVRDLRIAPSDSSESDRVEVPSESKP